MKKLWIAILILSLTICGCAPKQQERHFYAMDTVMTLQLWGATEEDLTACEDLVQQLEQKFSVTIEGSEIAKLNAAGSATLSADTAAVMKAGLEISEATGGAFCLSIYPALRQWGFTEAEQRVPSAQELEAVRPLIGDERIALSGNEISLPQGGAADLGGIAKGYAADQLAELLAKRQVEHYFLSLGGNVQVGGGKADGSDWRIGIADPAGGDPIGIVELRDGAVVTSGGYQRNFSQNGQTYHHILDPKTLAPAQSGLKSASVICQSGTLADGLSTALFVLGEQKALELWQELGSFEYILVTEDDRVIVSAGLKDQFTLNNSRYIYE